MTKADTAAFVALLDKCKAQVEGDPSGIVENPHLYDALDKILLRLCHGNRPDNTVSAFVPTISEDGVEVWVPNPEIKELERRKTTKPRLLK